MSKRDAARKELTSLKQEGKKLLLAFDKKEAKNFHLDYQRWYTKALKAVAAMASDRLVEFRNYYESDPKRKVLNIGTYTIQDYMRGIAPNQRQHPDFDANGIVVNYFYNQLAILISIEERIDSVLANIEDELYAEIQDSEIVVARQLAKVSHRAAGALIGVLIEGHLQKVALAHDVKIAKKNPTVSDLNDPLKNAGVIDTPTWRKITYLADIRNLCSHKKDVEPTKEQVEELIQGAEWLTKNVF